MGHFILEKGKNENNEVKFKVLCIQSFEILTQLLLAVSSMANR